MKIALFSDVHANLPALEACLKSIDQHKPDAIYCLGDLVGYNVWPNEVIQLIRMRGIPVIAGNYDQAIGLDKTECGFSFQTGMEMDKGKVSFYYTSSIMKSQERGYLRMLPLHLNILFELNSVRFNLLLVHGSPRRIDEYVHHNFNELELYQMMEDAGADIMCYGHTHVPYYKCLSKSSSYGKRYRHAINTGSVGKPKDGTSQGCYVLLNIKEGAVGVIPESIQVVFVRFDYDVEKAAKAVEDSPLSNEFADMLRKGY